MNGHLGPPAWGFARPEVVLEKRQTGAKEESLAFEKQAIAENERLKNPHRQHWIP